MKLNDVEITERVVQQKDKNNYKSIPFNQISSISVTYSEQLPLLYIGILLGIAGLLMVYNNIQREVDLVGVMSAGGGLCFIILYFLSRKHVISIASSTVKVETSTSGLSPGTISEFISAIESKTGH